MDSQEVEEARRDAVAARRTAAWLSRRNRNDGSWTPDDEADLRGWPREDDDE